MIIRLMQMPATLKGPDDADYKGQIPTRMRFLAPDAGISLMEVEKDTDGLIYTDMWRAAEASLLARRVKRGVQPPAYSPHNFGFAVDLDLYPILKKKGWTYTHLLKVMEAHGWFCHRRDGLGPDNSEAWHFNYLGSDSKKYLKDVDVSSPATWSSAVESRIYERYGSEFSMSPEKILTTLSRLKMYNGEIEASLTSQYARESIMVFQRAWDLNDDGDAGIKTQRTLAFVTAEKLVSPPTA